MSAFERYQYGPFGEVLRATGPMAKVNPRRFLSKYQGDKTDKAYCRYWACHPPAEGLSGSRNAVFTTHLEVVLVLDGSQGRDQSNNL